jgi:uncharacterized protein YbjQ (UPF0145 family)
MFVKFFKRENIRSKDITANELIKQLQECKANAVVYVDIGDGHNVKGNDGYKIHHIVDLYDKVVLFLNK